MLDGARIGGKNFLEIRQARGYARQPEHVERRVVGVDCENAPALFRNRQDFVQKHFEVRFQFGGAYPVVPREHFANVADFKPHFAAREHVDYRPLESPAPLPVERAEKLFRRPELRAGIVFLRAGALQNEYLERRELDGVEAQAPRAVGQAVAEIRAYPVENGHKIVYDFF